MTSNAAQILVVPYDAAAYTGGPAGAAAWRNIVGRDDPRLQFCTQRHAALGELTAGRSLKLRCCSGGTIHSEGKAIEYVATFPDLLRTLANIDGAPTTEQDDCGLLIGGASLPRRAARKLPDVKTHPFPFRFLAR